MLVELPSDLFEADEGDVVLITRGDFKGRVGTFDDTEGRQAVIYFGTLTRSAGYHLIGMKSFRRATMHDLLARDGAILREIGMQAPVPPERGMCLLWEHALILDTVHDRHMSFLDPTIGKKDVFFAFSGADREIVKCACVDLKGMGHNIWFYEVDSEAGDAFVAKMNAGIAETTYMVVFVSRSALESKAVQMEWEAGLTKSLGTTPYRVIPAMLEDCAIPPLLARQGFVDFRGEYLAGLAELAQVLRGSADIAPLS